MITVSSSGVVTGTYENPSALFKFSLTTADIELIGGEGNNLYKVLIG